MATPTDHSENRRQTKKVILLVIVLVGIAGWWTYRYLTTREWDVKPLTRKPSDFLATWRCLECGHELEDRVNVGPKMCPNCQKSAMYAHFRFACPRHGVFLIAHQYDEQFNVVETKIGDDPWKPIVTPEGEWNVVCPVCDGDLVPAESTRPASEEPPDSGG